MKTITAFVNTSPVNRILDIDEVRIHDPEYEEDRQCLAQIFGNYVNKGIVRFIVNPSVLGEIENTHNPQRRKNLLAMCSQSHFTPYNKTIFPFTFPATFITEEEETRLEELCGKILGFEKDQKVFLDAVSNTEVDVLLTTDRKHLAGKGLTLLGKPVFTPRQFLEYLQNIT